MLAAGTIERRGSFAHGRFAQCSAYWNMAAVRTGAEIAFVGMTDQGEPSEDKEAGLAKLEIPAGRAASGKIVAGIAISHPNRQIFPKTKLTKAGLAEYYAALRERFIAHVGNRPVSLLRCTNGMSGECFFQKHAGKGSQTRSPFFMHMPHFRSGTFG